MERDLLRGKGFREAHLTTDRLWVWQARVNCSLAIESTLTLLRTLLRTVGNLTCNAASGGAFDPLHEPCWGIL